MNLQQLSSLQAVGGKQPFRCAFTSLAPENYVGTPLHASHPSLTLCISLCVCRRSSEAGAGPRGGDKPYTTEEGHHILDIRFCK